MSIHRAFRRAAVPTQVAQSLRSTMFPAPTRGLIQSENFGFMNAGAALVSDNWVPTMRGVKIRGGCDRWCELPEQLPIISGFEYVSGKVHKMYAGQETKLFDVSSAAPVLIKDGQHSGNYAAAQLANAAGNFLTAVNDAGDAPLRFNGLTWTTLNGGEITGPPGSVVENGEGLSYVWKYRNRLFFIERDSMNAWYLNIDSINGELKMIPLAGAASKGGKLLFGASWSMDAGDGLDDKCIFVTDLGEILVFTGSDPSNASGTNPWHQEGRYQVSAPLGMNAHMQIGGDILIACVDGITPMSAAITKTADQLELAMLTRNIKPLWRDAVNSKRDFPWTMKKWDEYGGIFVTFPGGPVGTRAFPVANSATGAWGRIVGWDALCWMYLSGNLFFGTQGGVVMQADVGGRDDGQQYVATLVGGWGPFKTGGTTVTWQQARASFIARATGEPFVPQISACTDYVIKIPQPPLPGPDPGTVDVWDQGMWDQAKWDQPSAAEPTVLNTGWVSVGVTGFIHAPIVQTTISQQAKPTVELVAITVTFNQLGVNV